MQVTVVSPTGNEEPLGGEQVVVTGGVPFAAIGVSNEKLSAMPFGAVSVWGSGQETVGGSIGGGVTPGPVGLEQPPAANVAASITVIVAAPAGTLHGRHNAKHRSRGDKIPTQFVRNRNGLPRRIL